MLAYCDGGYTTNLPVAALTGDAEMMRDLMDDRAAHLLGDLLLGAADREIARR